MAGDWIKSSSMTSLVLRDRFLFATRRRLLASLCSFTTNSSGSYQPAYALEVKTLPTASDTIIIGIQATGACSVRVVYNFSTFVVLTTTAEESMVQTLAGIPINTWSRLFIEIKTNTGSPVTVHGIYIAERVLNDSELP
jgi:hypothetical protein